MPVPSSSRLVAAAAEGQRDERVVGVRIAPRQFAAAGKRALAADRDVRVLRHEQRFEAALLDRGGQLGDIDAVIDREIENADLHVVTPVKEPCRRRSLASNELR